jgi:hypothetical protein
MEVASQMLYNVMIFNFQHLKVSKHNLKASLRRGIITIIFNVQIQNLSEYLQAL